ncbi:hypothetical protein DIU31_016595 [Mucilaginibacter rubeus]|uniref:Uncharacterized protein n=1 Tax=Mucilaginibacter rubeus TaxID=2027860 RepID=A0AAE6JFZ4_9SPHI|nr:MULTISPECIES: hypothetical protein [Mucilaginibacter]QEM05052.1 hypothetical protein DIU31_016595 [Mucilaginibacter rubeus]QEM17646.1 hypothetical protein DIU38_016765 [Mucilaginibacter gossypii]QTE45831.1 hypothetical protein J3L19_10925 [Mucilaginibacter rubeus]QTE52428.1 hypothetical protein J3L21_10900 [Mucilaginibacter rubeus]QTE57516.1 hypothetical protein J3L23_02570 [Mucilaginibacter rubeus]
MTTITMPFTGNINQLLAYGKNAAKDYQGTFVGDTNKGQFAFNALGGDFIGEYKVVSNAIEITFFKKPFLIPKIAIENFLIMHIK